MNPLNLYTQVLAITHRYVGDMSEEYLQRRIRISLRHLDGPDQLSFADIPKLLESLQMTAHVHMGDRARVYLSEIESLLEPEEAPAP